MMKRWLGLGAVLFLAMLVTDAVAEPRTVWLDELDLGLVKQGWGKAQARTSVQEKPMRLNGAQFDRGVGSHAPGAIYVDLDGQAKAFHAVVGVDDETNGEGSGKLGFVESTSAEQPTGGIQP